jgi:hypothetical protein
LQQQQTQQHIYGSISSSSGLVDGSSSGIESAATLLSAICPWQLS